MASRHMMSNVLRERAWAQEAQHNCALLLSCACVCL
jgi:hypothetical protein